MAKHFFFDFLLSEWYILYVKNILILKNNIEGVFMDKKIKRLIIIIISVCIVGLVLTILYYKKYNDDMEYRKLHNEENIINSSAIASNSSKASSIPDASTLSVPPQNNSSKTTSSSQNSSGIPTSIYESGLKKMKELIFSGHYQQAASMAVDMRDKYKESPEQMTILSNVIIFNGIGINKDIDNSISLTEIKDPDLYVAMFYLLPPEYQYENLKNKNQPYIPAKTGDNLKVIKTEKGGVYDSDASKFYSELDKVKVYKVEIEVNATLYNIYCIVKDGFDMQISKIENADPANTNITKYDDYFKIYGKKKTDVFVP